jgi:glycosyltransferase involved in cell wall biosynthesis
MRIVIDLQACQNAGSRFRGIGRYSRSLAAAMLREHRGHDFWIALNGDLADAVEDIRAGFEGLLPQEQIVLWDRPFEWSAHLPGDPWRARVNEVVREDFLAALKPDIVHLASLFEGWGDAATTSIGRGSAATPRTAVTLYDLIPLAMSELYLPDARSRDWYGGKVEDLRRAGLCLAISEYTREEAMRLLGLPAERVVNISGSIDPMFRRLPPDPRRSTALAARLGLDRRFVMYTGGFDPRKNVAGLIRAFAGLPAGLRESRQLLLVGIPPADVRAELQALAAASGLQPADVCFAGFVPDEELVRLYNDCELYVFPSRYEGFGLPALEAMACGAPVIGADASSLPEVIGYAEAMFAPNSDEAMGRKIAEALEDAGLRQRLVEHGAERVGRFSWQGSARVALDAMEATVRRLPASPAGKGAGSSAEARLEAIGRQSEVLSAIVQGQQLPKNDLRRLAAAQSMNHPRGDRRRQLLVDVSNLSERDAHTGIQRVVGNILRSLLDVAPAGIEVQPVRFQDGMLRYARFFMHRLLGRKGPAPADDLVDPAPGDVFLGLDLSAHIIPHNMEHFERLRRLGVSMHFVVYDLIPWLRPDTVNPDALQLLWAWYRRIGVLADGLCCISAAVADDMADWCDEVRPERLRPLHIGHFHLGAEPIGAGARSAPATLPASSRPRFLMVGTIEPRKGHAQALAAFEALWARGTDVELVIAGKRGWLMEDFEQAVLAHPEVGGRLHWLREVDDAGLSALYRGSAALLAASEEEGYGLPIIEAASHGLPVIARDIPVFREVAGAHALYFDGFDADAIATAVQAWLSLGAAAPASTGMARLDWRQSARQLLDLVLDGRWSHAWLDGARHWFPARDQRMHHHVGRFERRDLLSDGNAGFLTFGPYVPMRAGRYRLRVLGAWESDEGGEPLLEVMAGPGQTLLLEHRFAPGQAFASGVLMEQELVLAEDAPAFEIRLFVHASTGLRLHGYELVSESADEPPA